MKRYKYHILLVLVCVVISALGVLYAFVSKDYSHGGRGGAIGVALSFGALFLSVRNRYNSIDVLDLTSQELFSILGQEMTINEQVEANASRIEALKNDLKRSQKSAFLENVALALAGVISTIFWGFGDLFAGFLVLLAS